VTGINNFEFSRREFFSTFNRRELIPAKNLILTYISKFVIKTLWDCKQRFTIPHGEECWDWIREELLVLCKENTKFRKLWENSGFSLE
jgi:Zn-finger protein